MKKLRKQLRDICESGPTALWLSGGKDSRLLLAVLLEEKLPFAILTFDSGWSAGQKRIVDNLIKKHDLSVFTYLPKSSAVVGNGSEISVISNYAVDLAGATIPIIQDLVQDDAGICGAFDSTYRFSSGVIEFKNHILGSKRREKHWAFGNRDVVTAPTFEVGSAKFHCPLFFWQDADVIREMKARGESEIPKLDSADTGNIVACFKCLHGKPVVCPKNGETIPPIDWNPKERLNEWRRAAGITVTASAAK